MGLLLAALALSLSPSLPLPDHLISIRYKCSQLTWEEAQQLLKQGHTYLDRDGDGEACESKRR